MDGVYNSNCRGRGFKHNVFPALTSQLLEYITVMIFINIYILKKKFTPIFALEVIEFTI